MPIGLARQFNLLSLQKAGLQAGMASLMLLLGAGSVHDATALNETRTLSFHHTHSGEDLTVTFKRDGRYDEEALKRLNHFLRDWRTQDEIGMDRHLFDIVWEVYRDVDAKEPIQIVSAYRTPATNAMLRRRSAHTGVARFSQHMLGHAMDFYIPGVPLEQIRFAGLRLQRGGVGFYPTSGSPFVHLDTGNIRHWPRMTREQLVKVFPDGRTVHIPTDGVPLKGYELAKADIERRGNGDDAATIGKSSFFAKLFGTRSNEEDEEAAGAPVVNDRLAAAKPADTKSAGTVPVQRVKSQLIARLQFAAADAQNAQPAKPKQPASASSDAPSNGKVSNDSPQTPADIINARGFWGDDAAPDQAASAQMVAAISARKALDSADPQSTATIPAAYRALAYAPAPALPADHANIVAASAPVPHGTRPPQQTRNAAATDINTVATKGAQGESGPITNSARIAAANVNDPWLRIVMLAPSVGTSMSVTMLGDADLTLMRAFFVKPQATVNMGFTDDPMMGMAADHFSGTATARLDTTAFMMHTAAIR